VQFIRLDQQNLKIHGTQPILEGFALAGFTGVVTLLGQGDVKSPGVHCDLGDKAVDALIPLGRRAEQDLAVADPLLQTLCAARDLADHPGLQHLAELLELGHIEKMEGK